MGDTDAACKQLTEVMAALAAPLASLRRNKGRIARIRNDHLRPLGKLVMELERENIDLIKTIDDLAAMCAHEAAHVGSKRVPKKQMCPPDNKRQRKD
jgi:hypothetical protein